MAEREGIDEDLVVGGAPPALEEVSNEKLKEKIRRCKSRERLIGQTYQVRRECIEARDFLLPSTAVNQVISYCAAEASRITGVRILALGFMPNFYEMVLEDPGRELSLFMAFFNQHCSRALNRLHERTGELWAAGSFTEWRLVDDEAVEDALMEVWSIHIRSGYVDSEKDWPGVRSTPKDMIGFGSYIPRPKFAHFRENGPWRDVARLDFHLPKHVSLDKSELWLKTMIDNLYQLEKEEKRLRKLKGLKVIGAGNILKAKPSRIGAALSPVKRNNVRAGLKENEVRAKAQNKLFRRQYVLAMHRWCDGDRDVSFPAGTYWMSVYHQATVDVLETG